VRARNRRHNYRVLAEVPAVLHAAHGGALGPPLSATVLDLSASGARVVVHDPILPRSAVCLRIGEGGDTLELSAEATVVRLDRPTPGSVTVALEFTTLDLRARIALSRSVLRLARDLGQGSDPIA
jgi:c-di-GMP-binding flagellar brake protein YcgR